MYIIELAPLCELVFVFNRYVVLVNFQLVDFLVLLVDSTFSLIRVLEGLRLLVINNFQLKNDQLILNVKKLSDQLFLDFKMLIDICPQEFIVLLNH